MLLTLWDYAHPADQVLRALKFHRVEGLAARIADEAWNRHAEELAATDAVVAVPLPWTRRIARGFNQSESIARPIACRLGLDLLSPLRRAPSSPMSGADAAERRRRARHSIGLRRGARVPKRVVLVDDVFTTGATLTAAARVLRRGGATEIVALVPFWTPPTPNAPFGRRRRLLKRQNPDARESVSVGVGVEGVSGSRNTATESTR